jgi:hypothetical protein
MGCEQKFPKLRSKQIAIEHDFINYSSSYMFRTYYVIIRLYLLLTLALQPVVGFGLSSMSLHSVLSPALSIFSLPALEDLFLLLLSILSWAFPFVSSLPVLA